MRGLFVALAAWMMLAGPAGAAVVFQQSGTTNALNLWASVPGSGRYHVQASITGADFVSLYYGYNLHWDVFVAPPPRSHDENVDGNSGFYDFPIPLIGDAADGEFQVPITRRRFFFNGEGGEFYSAVPTGTPLYYEERAEDAGVGFSAFTFDGRPFDYSISISVPEPSTWAMIIVGFGLLGAALRWRRASHLVAA